MYKIDYNSYRSVASFGHRVRFLVLHYTAQNFADSVTSLTGKSATACAFWCCITRRKTSPTR
ncbi:TPA: hypothetical protein ACXI4A_002159 [Serratia marcescens]